MTKYQVTLDKPSVTLNIMGRTKVFKKDDEVFEDIYTTTYPKYFRKLGEIKGYASYLSVPVFIPNTIQEFVRKEAKRSETTKQIHTNPSIKEVEIDEIVEAIDEHIEIEDNRFINTITNEGFDETDVKVETEEKLVQEI